MTQTLDREARRAAMLARRTEWKPTEEVTVKAAEVVVGDFVVRVPRQQNVRGATVEQTVKAVTVEHDKWGMNTRKGGRRFPVESRRFEFHDHWTPGVDLPSTFDVVVRRPVAE